MSPLQAIQNELGEPRGNRPFPARSRRRLPRASPAPGAAQSPAAACRRSRCILCHCPARSPGLSKFSCR
jgi:hypothetical protein